tara:strand:- start:120 stop:386 length:267 start_codon:yes stop_codon:yes gene_type:complete
MNNFLIIAIVFAILILMALAALSWIAWSAKKTLIRGGTAWSAKNMPINRSSPNDQSASGQKRSSSMLESISNQTNEYLNDEEEFKENS